MLDKCKGQTHHQSAIERRRILSSITNENIEPLPGALFFPHFLQRSTGARRSIIGGCQSTTLIIGQICRPGFTFGFRPAEARLMDPSSSRNLADEGAFDTRIDYDDDLRSETESNRYPEDSSRFSRPGSPSNGEGKRDGEDFGRFEISDGEGDEE